MTRLEITSTFPTLWFGLVHNGTACQLPTSACLCFTFAALA